MHQIINIKYLGVLIDNPGKLDEESNNRIMIKQKRSMVSVVCLSKRNKSAIKQRRQSVIPYTYLLTLLYG